MARLLPLLLLLVCVPLAGVVAVAGPEHLKLVAGSLAGAVFLFLLVTRERLGLFLLVASFPFVNVVVLNLPGLALSVSDLTTIAFLTVHTVRVLIGKKQLRPIPYLGHLLIFIAICAIHILVSTNKVNSVSFFMRFLLIVAIFFIIIGEIDSIETVKKIMFSFFCGLLAMTVFNIAELRVLSSSVFHRVTAGSKNPNVFADMLGATSLITVGLLSLTKRRSVKVLTFMIIGFLLFLLLNTYSRWGWIAFSCGLVYWMIVSRIDIRWISLLIIAVVLMVTVDDRILEIIGKRSWLVDKSSTNRFATYTYALRSILERPIVGIGFDQFTRLYEYIWVPRGAYQRAPHNLYLKIGVEMGIFGLIAFLTYLARIAVGLLRGLLHASLPAAERTVAVTASAILVQQLVSQLSKSGMASPLFWLSLALAVGLTQQLARVSGAPGWRRAPALTPSAAPTPAPVAATESGTGGLVERYNG